MKKDFLQRSFLIVFSLCVLSMSNITHALPFNITPKAGTTLPTSVNVGGSVAAYYTVTNQTSSVRNNNYVQWLPPNVRQVTTNGTYNDTCGATFNLSPKGQLSDSCTLELLISGEVNASDRNQHNHLFVCFPGGKACSGTNFPLNVNVNQVASQQLVSITIAPVAIAADNPNTNVNVALGANATKQLQATGHYSDNTTADLSSIANWSSSQTSVASVSSNSGLVASNTAAGQTTISATTDGVTGQMTVSVVPFAYVTDYYVAGGSTYYCAFASNIITSCTSTTNSPYHPWGLGVDPTAPNLYISGTGDGTVSGMKIYRCPLSNTGAISAACTDVGYQNILNGQTPVYIAINPTGTIAYLTNANGTTAPVVGYCKINASTGSFENCASLCNSSYCGSNGIVISPDNKWAYISGITYGKPSIHACPITSSGAFGTCLYAYSGGTANQLYGLAINETGTMLYATEILDANTISIYKCIISSPGHISSCTTSVQDISASPISAVALNPTASYVYTVGNAFSSSTSFCSALVPTGTPASCTRPSSPTSFNQLRGIGIF